MIAKSRRQFVRTLALAAGGVMIAPKVSAQDADDLPNLFISPCGKPFRAAHNAPYPVADWFKQADANGDGKLDHGEFMADTGAFFKVLDQQNVGYLDDYDIAVYERRIAPEILGLQASLNGLEPAPRIWLAQGPGMGGAGSIDPGGGGGDDDSEPKEPKDLDESKVGAAPYSFFNSPEPVTAADTQFRGVVTKADFMALAERHFTALDSAGAGYLTLATLPKTEVQLILERGRRKPL